jgi:hypothetical protein
VRLAVLLLVAAGSPALLAKDLLFVRYTLTGEKAFDRLGGSLAALGDIDGDGVPDFAAGATEHAAAGLAGKVVLFSGKDGGVIRTLRSKDSLSFFGQWVANAGDIDGDGANDVLSCDSYHVQLQSSRTGEVLGVVRDDAFSERISLIGAGDVNGDGIPDFAIGNTKPLFSHYSSVRVLSGKDMEALWTKQAAHRDDSFGMVVAPVGDLDADGVPDLAVTRNSSPADDRHGIVEFLSGQDGSLIRESSLKAPEDRFGGNIEVLTDVDGDGMQDLAISASGYSLRGYRWAGKVDLYSARSGESIWSRSGQNFERGSTMGGDNFGAQCARSGDVDGDGFEDLLVLSPRNGFAGLDTPWVHLLSGKSGNVLTAYDRDSKTSQFGQALSALGDIDGDGRPEFLIAAPEWTLDQGPEPIYELGRIHCVSYLPEQRPFLRGDADLDLDVDLGDIIATLEHLFAGKRQPCEEAMDINADGRLNDTDALRLAWHLFVSGHSPWPPYPDCGRFEAFGERLPCERSACE